MRFTLLLLLALLCLAFLSAEAGATPTALEAARALNLILLKQGRLQPATVEQRAQVMRINTSILNQANPKLLPQLLAGAGWNSSGGGGGVACFDSILEAKSALNRAGVLKRGMISAIRSLEPFDVYNLLHGGLGRRRIEFEEHGLTHFVYPRSGAGADDFLEEQITTNLGSEFPLLTERLVGAIDAFPMARWEALTGRGLPYYPDVDPGKSALPKDNCVYVQLVTRYVNDHGRTAHQVHFLYDDDLLQRMRALAVDEVDYQRQLAVLRLHEATYFLARELGSVDASQVDNIVELVIFDDPEIDFFRTGYYGTMDPTDLLNKNIARIFSDAYSELLAPLSTPSSLPSKAKLFHAWSSLIAREKREVDSQWAHDCKWMSNGMCLDGAYLLPFRVLTSRRELNSLSPAEAFFLFLPIVAQDEKIPFATGLEPLVALSAESDTTYLNVCRFFVWRVDPETSFANFVRGAMTDVYPQVKVSLIPPLFQKIKAFCGSDPQPAGETHQGNKSN